MTFNLFSTRLRLQLKFAFVLWISQFHPTNPIKYKSAPGCPISKNGEVIWLYEENGQNCQKVNERCGENMISYPHPNRNDRIHSFCDCFDAQEETEEEIELINNRELSRCLKDVRSQIYIPSENRCYSAFHQGPCSVGEWLVLNGFNQPICAKNTCSSLNDSSDPLSTVFKFSHSGTDQCYTTRTQGYCPNSYTLRFSPNDWLPKCRYSPSSGSECKVKHRAIIRSRCKPGSRRDYLSNCSKSFNPR